MEFASEHRGRSTSFVTARNNLVYDATAIGIAIGGYDRRRGCTEGAVIVNNTVVGTDGVSLLVQFDTSDNVIAEQHVRRGSDRASSWRTRTRRTPATSSITTCTGPTEGADRRACGSGRMRATRDFRAWRAARATTRHSAFADPGFVDPSARGLSIDGRLAGGRRGRVQRPERSRRPRRRAPAQGGRHRPGRVRAGRAAGAPRRPRSSGPGGLSRAIWHGRAKKRLGDPPSATGATASGRPTTADRSRSGRRGTNGDRGARALRDRRWTSSSRARCSWPTSASTRRSAIAGSVQFEVWGDGEMLASSAVLRGRQVSAPIAADLDGVERARADRHDGRRRPVNDHADWGDARLACTG